MIGDGFIGIREKKEDPSNIDRRTYIVNPSQCGLMNFSEMINNTTNTDSPTINRNYFTSSKGNKPMFTDVTDDYLYTELDLINMNDQANGKAYNEICSKAPASKASTFVLKAETVGAGAGAL
jgi:predicted protein tyrosine phosphatase